MSNEIWREVSDTPGYEVSNLGRVRSVDRDFTVKNQSTKTTTIRLPGRILRPQKMGKNYRMVWAAGRSRKIHRLVAEAFLPNPNQLPEVNHINGDKNDNRVENLEWCTTRENAIHAYLLGLRQRKFTPEQIRAIRAAVANGTPSKTIAQEHGVSPKSINAICRRYRYADVS